MQVCDMLNRALSYWKLCSLCWENFKINFVHKVARALMFRTILSMKRWPFLAWLRRVRRCTIWCGILNSTQLNNPMSQILARHFACSNRYKFGVLQTQHKVEMDKRDGVFGPSAMAVPPFQQMSRLDQPYPSSVGYAQPAYGQPYPQAQGYPQPAYPSSGYRWSLRWYVLIVSKTMLMVPMYLSFNNWSRHFHLKLFSQDGGVNWFVCG